MTQAIVTDIEGTTSSLSFVKDVLFPYAKEHLADYVQSHAQDPTVRAQLEETRRLNGKALDDNQVIAQLLRWIDEDKKITPLKTLQGMIWETGFRQGHFQGHIYADAVQCLKAWHRQGLKLYVYSSGSVQAQKLLFGNTAYGDLTPLFSGYFDTTLGPKREISSYQAIAQALALDPGEITFLSDIREELDAARAAGMHTFWLVREGNIDANATHPQVQNFDSIKL